MSAIDVALTAIGVALERDPGNAGLVAAREKLVAQRGTEVDRIEARLTAVEARMREAGLSSDEAEALLAEHRRLQRSRAYR